VSKRVSLLITEHQAVRAPSARWLMIEFHSPPASQTFEFHRASRAPFPMYKKLRVEDQGCDRPNRAVGHVLQRCPPAPPAIPLGRAMEPTGLGLEGVGVSGKHPWTPVAPAERSGVCSLQLRREVPAGKVQGSRATSSADTHLGTHGAVRL